MTLIHHVNWGVKIKKEKGGKKSDFADGIKKKGICHPNGS